MAIVPKSFYKRIEFFESRAHAIEAHAAALGLSTDEVVTFRSQVDAARDAYQRQYDARKAARSATLGMHLAVKQLHTTGIMIVERVRATAGLKNDPSLLNLASVAPIKKKSPIGTPGTPTALTTTLDAVGNLKLIWKCKHPRGAQQTMYRIYRRLGFNGEKQFIGLVYTKHCVDESIPAGVTQLVYEIQAVRSTREGQAANFNVNFGSNVAAAATLAPSARGKRAA